MQAIVFEWDEDKNTSNIAKHGISFEEAQAVFFDQDQYIEIDARKYYGELREITIGKIKDGNTILVVVHTDRKNIIRIISARKASNKEIKLYYAYNT
jgi:uncharacterized protein